MNMYARGQTEVKLNGTTIGYASGVSIDHDANRGMKVVNIMIERSLPAPKEEKVISPKENYDQFFKKFAKAFNKE